MVRTYQLKCFATAFLFCCSLCIHQYAYSQATVLGSQGVDGTYATYDLADQGIFRQMRYQANVSSGSGTRNWEFCEGISGSPSYSTNWRPFTGPLTIAGYDQTIAPVGGTASAVFNTGFGGTAGYMPAITSGNYYTFNITEYSTPGLPVNEYMGVLETNYAPSDIATITQSPSAGSVMADNSVLVTVDCATAPFAGEYIYLRWSTTVNFLTSTLTQVTMTGTMGTAIIPCQPDGTTIYYYVYSSNRTSATILADVGTHGQVAHDMSTLVLNNNGGPNYQYTVGSTTSACGTYYVPSTCFPTIASFVSFLNGTSVTCPVDLYVTAGHTETAPAGGIHLSQTGTLANPITFQKYGVGANPVIYAQTGTVSMTSSSTFIDNIFTFNGSDYITIDAIDLTDNNASAPGTMEAGYAFYKLSETDGCQHNTIRNCNITLNKNNTATGPAEFRDGSRGIYMGNVARSGLTTAYTIGTVSGRNDANSFYLNTIQNVANGIILRGYNDPGFTYFDQDNIVGAFSLGGNTIQNYGGGGAITAYGMYIIYLNNTDISNNTIANAAGGGTAHISTLYGIFHSSNTGTTPIDITIRYNDISLSQGANTNAVTGIRTGNASQNGGTIRIANNTIHDCTYMAGASGTFSAIDQELNCASVEITNNTIQNNILNTTSASPSYLIYNNNSSTTVLVDGNTLITNQKTGTGAGTFSGYFNQQGTIAGSTETISNNTIDGLSVLSTSTASAAGIRLLTSTSQTKTVNNNTISNITGGTGTSFWTTGMVIDGMNSSSMINDNTISNINSGAHAIGINCASQASISTSANQAFTITDNSVSNISSTGNSNTAAGIAIYTVTSGGSSVTCSNNTIDNISSSGTTSVSVRGINMGGGTSGSNYIINNCNITNLQHSASSGIAGVTGINLTVSSPTVSIYNCNINELYTNSNSAFAAASGIAVTSGTTTFTIYNNYIQRVYAPSATNNLAAGGIAVFATLSTYNIYYNTIALGQNTTLSGGTNFGCVGVYYPNAAVTTPLNLRNNIIYINANVNGTGVASCVRRAGGTANTVAPNFMTSCNNNYYWINTASSNYIYAEGVGTPTLVNGWAWSGATTSVASNLNNDPCFNIAGAAPSSYKGFYGTTREQGSFYDAIPFEGGAILPENIRLTTGTTNYAESHAGVIAGISADWEGNARSLTTPDIGADEGSFVLQTPSCDLLPVELIEFTGWRNETLQVNQLFWKTATEINSYVFEIERSLDGIYFEKIGEVDAAGNSNAILDYQFIDDASAAGYNYYRLKMVDADDTYEYSNIITIFVVSEQLSNFILYPNPVIDVLYISFSAEQDAVSAIIITDMIGKEVLRMPVTISKGNTNLQIPTNGLAQGAYMLRISNAGYEHSISQFIKQH
ncbi:MAG: T9SS type A sorting domain-containing protein [Chitinophagales bacterium]